MEDTKSLQKGSKYNDYDEDGDGMVDGWEEIYGLDPSDASDAEQDPDGDGWNNADEFVRIG